MLLNHTHVQNVTLETMQCKKSWSISLFLYTLAPSFRLRVQLFTVTETTQVPPHHHLYHPFGFPSIPLHSHCRFLQGWQHNKHLELYLGLQRHSTIRLAPELLLLWLSKSGRSSRQSISSFLWRCFSTTLLWNRTAQRLQRWVRSKRKGK